MKQFPKSILVKSISLILIGGASQILWADTTLPTITVEAAAEQQAYANGALKDNADLGALGSKKIIDTPFSVAEYSSKLIEDQQAKTVGDVLQNDASIRVTTNQGHLNENFKLRGFDVNHEDMSYNGFFGVAPYGRMPTAFLESVTVLKGPNALVAGVAPTGSVGGVVIANSKRADKDLTRVSASLEDGGYYQSGFDISRRMGQDNEFGVRVNGTYADGEHVIDGMNDRLASGAIAADYTAGKVKINFDAYAIKENRKGGSPAMVAMGGNTSLNQVIAPPKGDSNYFPHLEGNSDSQFAGLSGEYKFSPDLKAFAGIGYVEKSYDGHLFGTRLIVNKADGSASSQYYRVASEEHNTVANAGLEAKFDTGAVKHTLGLRTDYLARKYTLHKKATQQAFTTNLYDPSKNGSMPLSYPEVAPLGDNKYISYTLTDQLSMLNDKLQLIVGARYQDIDTKNLQAGKSYQEDKVSPSLGVVVKPFGDSLSLYASYVEGLSEGATVDNAKDANNRKSFAPFQTKQYEMGAKYQKGTWLNTLAVYQIDKPGTMVSSYSNGDPLSKISQITTDDAETRSRGVEWAFSGEIYSGLNLLGSMAYIDAEYIKAAPKQGAAVQGNTVYGVPDFTATLGFDYAVPYVQGLNVNARANYVSEQYLNDANTLELPDYTILDLGARYATKLGGVNTTFLANIDNATDKQYWEGAFNSGYALVGGPRTYKVGVTFDF